MISFRNQNFYHDDEKCYCQDTIKHLKENEKRFTYPIVKINAFMLDGANEDYLKRYSLNILRQRSIEWMISIQDFFTNCEETLEMATRLFDYIFYNDFYAKVGEVERTGDQANIQNEQSDYFKQECLYLVALTCYFLSCKFWERFPPKLTKLILLTEYAYTDEQLLQMEKKILMKLDFDLKIPLISQYLEFYMLHEREYYLSKVTTICHYLSNLTQTEMIFTNRLSSSLAAVILTFSKMILYLFTTESDIAVSNCANEVRINGISVYDEHLFEVEDFYEILKDMWLIFINSVTNKNLFKLQKLKFSDAKYSFLCVYLENIDMRQLQLHYKLLIKRVTAYLAKGH